MDGLTLAGEFAPATRAQWLELVAKVLNGADPHKRLVRTTRDGLEIHPLYLRDGAPHPDAAGWPGMSPFLRGGSVAGTALGGWEICQRHAHPDPAAVNRTIREDLDGGVQAILLRVDTGLTVLGESADGCCIVDLGDLETALAGVDLAEVPVALEGGRWGINAALMVALLRRRGTDPARVRVQLGADPLGAAARGFAIDLERGMRRAAEILAFADAHLPQASAVRADGHLYHAGGASEAQELAAALASAVAHLRAAEAIGVPLDRAAGKIAFRLAADADLFMTVAKLRAARWLWARVQQACGIAPVPMRLHALTATRMYARRDPWNNLVRGTLATLAAGLGGADSITVLPFDHALGLPDPLARRLARNTHHILQAESGIHRVIDPLGGAWFVEDLTRGLAQQAWSLFQAIESGGGMVAMLRRGTIQDWVVATRDARLRDVATRREPVIGVGDFPLLDEPPWQPEAVDATALRARVEAKLATAADTVGRPFEELVSLSEQGCALVFRGTLESYTPLPAIRVGQEFEALRDRAERARAERGVRPMVGLVCLGPTAEHAARASFAENLLAAGGIATLPTDPLATAGVPPAAFLCGNDAAYASDGPATIARLVAAGCRRLWVVGRPPNAAELEAAGADGCVGAGTDAVALLETIHEVLDTAP